MDEFVALISQFRYEIGFWSVCGIVAGFIGSNKGAGCTGFFVGFLLGPLGIIAAYFMTGDRIPCPYCREYIDPDASRCPKCQRDLDEGVEDNDTKKCPSCAELIKLEATKCRFCGKEFTPTI